MVTMQDLYQIALINLLTKIFPSTQAQKSVSSSLPSVTPSPSKRNQELLNAYQKGFQNWGSPPAATMSSQMIEESQKYPIFQKYPFLLPALSIAESGGGRNMLGKYVNGVYPSNENRQYNMFGWGFDPKNEFNPKSPMEVMEHVASGIGIRFPQYQKFRDTGNLLDFSNTYSPYDKERNPYGGQIHAKNVQQIMDVFQSFLPKGN